MSIFIKASDFTGDIEVARDQFTEEKLQKYIDKYEVCYLQDLLGAELYEDFKKDFELIGSEPTGDKFKKIWESFAIDHSGFVMKSQGIKAMLGLFIYFEFTRDQPIKNTIAGNKKNKGANSEGARFIDTNIYTNYNQGIATYKTIQWCICYNPDDYDYENFNGQCKGLISII